MVLLPTKNLRLPAFSSSKLRLSFVGPFKVLAVKGTAATLQLPPEMKIHPTFHASLLRPYLGASDAAVHFELPQVEGEA